MSKPSGDRRHAKPQFSINALMGYMVANAMDRESIIRDQKYPDENRPSYYRWATKAIIGFIVDNRQDLSILDAMRQKLVAIAKTKPKTVSRYISNIDAIDAFQNWYPNLEMKNLSPRRAPQRSKLLSISNVRVSVRPEILLRGVIRKKEHYGAIKLYISKGRPIEEATASYGSACVRRLCQGTCEDGWVISPSLCSVIDIFGQKQVFSPSSTSTRIKQIKAACREIANRWPAI